MGITCIICGLSASRKKLYFLLHYTIQCLKINAKMLKQETYERPILIDLHNIIILTHTCTCTIVLLQ